MAPTYTFKAIGTTWNILIKDALADEARASLFLKIQDRIGEFDKAYSRFREDSIVSKIAQEAGVYTLPKDSKLLFETYRKMYELSDGLVTPLMGKILVDAGYDKDYSLKPKDAISKAVDWDDSISFDFPNLTIQQPTAFDFGAIGKGYIIDLIGELLESNSITNYMINAGGDIRHRSSDHNQISVGLENPVNTTQAIGVARVLNKSICGSAGNRRAWAHFTHIINPKTVSSTTEILAVWSIADTTRVADALTTALYFVPIKTLQDNFSFEYAILYKSGALEWSPGFPGEFFT